MLDEAVRRLRQSRALERLSRARRRGDEGANTSHAPASGSPLLFRSANAFSSHRPPALLVFIRSSLSPLRLMSQLAVNADVHQ